MNISEEQIRMTALALGVEMETIDQKRMGQALSHVRRKTTEYYDMLSNHGQLHGNMPHSACVVLMYDALGK